MSPLKWALRCYCQTHEKEEGKWLTLHLLLALDNLLDLPQGAHGADLPPQTSCRQRLVHQGAEDASACQVGLQMTSLSAMSMSY